MPLTPRHLNRYRQIAEVLVSHGFGALLTQLGLDTHLDLPRRWLQGEEYRPESRTAAEHSRLALEELGPTFVKFGQILSTRPDLLPPAYIDELIRLQDRVPPVPWELIKDSIEAELDDAVENIFADLNPTPIAAASLAQVHAATLPNGHEVVVKVQRPNIHRTIDLDLDILYELAQLAQERTPLGDVYDLVEIAEDFAITLRNELDYRIEGRNADRFQANFANETYLYVPDTYWEYTTHNVLVQERIIGIKIDDIQALDEAGYDRHQIAVRSAHFVIKEILEDGFFHADPHPGNILIMPGERLGLIDFGTVGRLRDEDRRDLVRLYIGVIRVDTDDIVKQLIRLGAADQRINKRALRRDIQQLLLRYQGLPLEDIRVGEIMEELRPIVYEHHLRLPSDLWLLSKTLMMMEGVGQQLDPGFDIFAVSQPYIRRFMIRMWLPTTWGPVLLDNIGEWTELLSNFPGHLAYLLDRMERNELGVQFLFPQIDQAINRLDRMANRFILGILLSAFILALAMLIPTLNLTWPWNWFTWVVIIGFAVMSFLGLWLMWSIWRSGGGV